MVNLLKNWLHRYFSDPQVVILGILLTLISLLIYKFGNMLIPVFASIVIAFLLDGLVIRLNKFGVPNVGSVIIVFLFFIAFLFALLMFLLPLIVTQIGQLLDYLPENIKNVQVVLMRLPEKYPDYISQAQLKQVLDYITKEVTSVGQIILTNILTWVRGVITILVYFILVPLMVFFFLKDKRIIIAWIQNFLPEDHGMASEVWEELNQQIGNYVRGKIWEILIVWFASYVTFKLLNLKFTMLISLFVGLSVLVPYIGATVMYLPVLLIAYIQWGWSSQFAYIFLAYTIIQALDGNLLVPILLSGVVNLHPVAIIVAVLVFGGLWGIWGLFFAIPLATLVHAIIKVWSNKLRNQTETDGEQPE